MPAALGPTTSPHATVGRLTDSTAAPANPSDQGALFRWAPLMCFALLLLGLTRHAAKGISDPDTLWHVLAGQHLAGSGDFSGPDPLSDFSTLPWVYHQWLPELAMAAAHAAGGLPGVVWLGHAGIVAVCVALYWLCRGTGGHLAAAVSAAVAVLGTADSLSPRPQLVGFVLLAVTVMAWFRTAEDLRPRWWLVPLTWTWACSHGTWVVGIMVGALVVATTTIERRPAPSLVLRLAAVPAFGTITTLVTPVGPELFQSITAVRAVSPYIQEWQPSSLTDLQTLIVLGMAAVAVAVWVRGSQRPRWAHVALLGLALVWTLLHARTVPIGAILLAPLTSAALSAAVGRGRPAVRRQEVVGLATAVAATLALGAVVASSAPRQPAGVPSRLDAQLHALPRGAVIYNTDVLGGWLMWSHPHLRHTSDTRAEVYGVNAIRSYFTVMAAQPGWEGIFDRFDPAAALVIDDAPLVAALQHRGWTEIGRDGGYVLLQDTGK